MIEPDLVRIMLHLNSYALALAAAMIAVIRLQKDRYSLGTRLFQCMLSASMLMLALEALTWILNGRPGMEALAWAANFAYFLFLPLTAWLWILYLDYHIFGTVDHLRRRWYYLPPLGVHVLVMLVGAATGSLFHIGPGNVYGRGMALYWDSILSMGLLLYSIRFLVLPEARQQRNLVAALVVFVSLPLATVILELSVVMVPLAWPVTVLSEVVIFLAIEYQKGNRDYLTGLFNRKHLDSVLRWRTKGRGQHAFGLLLLDLDGFKGINDRFGHQAGDEALQTFATVLGNSVKHRDVPCRFAGDEFVVILELSEAGQIEVVISRLRRNLDQLNVKEVRPWKLQFSAGWAMFDPIESPGPETLFARADEAMYREKLGRGSSVGEEPGNA